MALLSKDQILNADDRETKEVEVPEWGGSVLVRTLSGQERDKFETSMVSVNKRGEQSQNFSNLRARLVALCVVDETGNRLFASPGDVILLGNKSVVALQRVFNVCQDLNGLSDGDVDELTESFDETPSESFSSD